MMDYFSNNEMQQIISELGTLSVDEQVHINHADCPAGEDRKKRLYIKRVQDGYLLFCHHCGLRGSYRNAKLSAREIRGALQGASKDSEQLPAVNREGSDQGGPKLPDDIVPLGFGKPWPDQANAFVKWLTQQEIRDAGITYSASAGGVVLPIFGHVGDLFGYQVRRIPYSGRGPKYITRIDKGVANGCRCSRYLSGYHIVSNDALVLCEDILSAVKVSKFCPSVALLSTTLGECDLRWMAFAYDKFLIFLDDDNAQVRADQLKLKRKLDLSGTAEVIHSGGVDPKELDNPDIATLIRRALGA